MYWRRYRLSNIPIDDPKAFEIWLRVRWMEKDSLIRRYNRTGSFPCDTGVSKTPDGNILRGCGYVESSIKPFHWYEFLQVFMPIGLLSLVLFTFYGALPKAVLNTIGNQSTLDKVQIFKDQLVKDPKKTLIDPIPAPKGRPATGQVTLPRKVDAVPKASVKKIYPPKNPTGKGAPKLGPKQPEKVKVQTPKPPSAPKLQQTVVVKQAPTKAPKLASNPPSKASSIAAGPTKLPPKQASAITKPEKLVPTSAAQKKLEPPKPTPKKLGPKSETGSVVGGKKTAPKLGPKKLGSKAASVC